MGKTRTHLTLANCHGQNQAWHLMLGYSLKCAHELAISSPYKQGCTLQDRDHTDLYWMEQALKEAQLTTDDVPVGCVIVREGKMLARGHNEKEQSQDPTDHAELVAIRKASGALKTWRLAGTTLYTTLEPCPMCAEAIMQTRVSRLVFGAYDINSGAVGSKFNLFLPGRPYPVPEVTGGILQAECQALLINFFRQRRQQHI